MWTGLVRLIYLIESSKKDNRGKALVDVFADVGSDADKFETRLSMRTVSPYGKTK